MASDTIRKEKLNEQAASFVAGILILIVILITATQALCYWIPGWWRKEYAKYDTPQYVTGEMSLDDAVYITEQMLDYCIGRIDTLDDTEATIDGVTAPFFTEREKLHLADCRAIFLGAVKFRIVALLVTAGLLLAVLGIFLAFTAQKITYSFCCLMVAGICDLFDGMVARRCKRTEEEKLFGIELDSLVDVMSFIALPICIFIALGLTTVWHLLIYLVFALFGVARLAYFNIATADSEKAIKYYIGLPVTYTALIFPMLYLLSAVLTESVFVTVFSCGIVVVSILEIIKVNVPKPKGIWYGIFGLMAIGMLIIYLAVL